MEVNYIKKVNDLKLNKYESLLDIEEERIEKLKLKEHELTIKYNKNNKEITKMKKIINIGGTSVIVILTIPVALQSVVAGLAVGGLFGGWLVLSQKTFNKLRNIMNINDNCTELDQSIISNEIFEGEYFRKTLENSIFVRNVLNAILDNQYVAISELETVSNVFNDNDILNDFNMDEFNILNEYIKEYSSKEETINNSLNLEYSNTNENTKEKVKIKK